MDYYYYIIIGVVILKICIWICVIYFRSQRVREARVQRRFVVVDSRSTGQHPSRQHVYPHPQNHGLTNIPPNHHNDRSAIVNFEQPPAMSEGPPPYTQVISEQTPPTYSEVIAEQGAGNRTPIPPHFTPPTEEAKY